MTSITLPEFLRARFAEDEAVARAADGPVWDSGDGNISEGGLYANDWSITWFDLGETNPEQRISGANWKRHAQENADHAARHDPARVLAECEAKRRIVELHDSWPTLVETPIETETTNDIDGYVLRASKQINWLTTREYVARFGIEPPTAPILALLALPYADHEDYRPEWKP